MSKHSESVIVVRKRKGKHGGHHGGSWKIAYADFMTAMMAFFLVMWLVSTSSPQQLQQISEYFKMPLKVALAHGNKSSLSQSTIPGGGDNFVKKDGEVQKHTLNKIDNPKSVKTLKRARDKLESLIKNDPRLSNFQSNLRISLTNDGLLIQIIDSQDRPMFKIGSRTPEPYMKDILQALVPVLNEQPNHITLTGHTDSLPYASAEGYSNWELSTDRANASRRMLVGGGMTEEKFLRVIGMADVMSLDNLKPGDPANRRISILVLSHEKENKILGEDTLLQNISYHIGSEKIKSELKIKSVQGDSVAANSERTKTI